MTHTDCLHPKTATARRACRVSRNRKALLVPMINEAYDVRWIEATKNHSEYNDAEYDRAVRVVKGLLITFTDGDEEWAKALDEAWLDSNEHIEYYLTNWTRDRLVYDMHMYDKANEEELEKRLGIHWSQLEAYDESDDDPDAARDAIVDRELGV